MSQPKIFAFCCNVEGWSDMHGQAVAEDGTPLADHLSSNEDWSRYDMCESPSKHQVYAAHYPDGYDLVWLGHEPPLDQHPELKAALGIVDSCATKVERVI